MCERCCHQHRELDLNLFVQIFLLVATISLASASLTDIQSKKPYLSISGTPILEGTSSGYIFRVDIENVGSRAIAPGAQLRIDVLHAIIGDDSHTIKEFKGLLQDQQPLANALVPSQTPTNYTSMPMTNPEIPIEKFPEYLDTYCIFSSGYLDDILLDSHDQAALFKCDKMVLSKVPDNYTSLELRDYFQEKIRPSLYSSGSTLLLQKKRKFF